MCGTGQRVPTDSLQTTSLLKLWAWAAVGERALTGMAKRTSRVSSGQCSTEGLRLVPSSSGDVPLLAVSRIRGLCEKGIE